MTASPYQQFAKQFLDLWQKQVSSVMSDKDFVATMLNMVQSMQGFTGAYETDAAGAAESSVSPDALGRRLDEFDYRLRMCEERIAALDAPDKRPAKPAPKRRAKRSPAKAGKPAARR